MIIFTNSDISIPVTLEIDRQTFSISDTATVRAAIVNMESDVAISSIATLSKDAIGADWGNSKVVAVFQRTETANWTQGDDYRLQISVLDDDIKTVWTVTEAIQIKAGMV